MERHEFNKFHLGMILISLVGVITIIWAVLAIRGAKIREIEEAKKKAEKTEAVQEVIVEEPEVLELPEGVKEPDFTFEQFEVEKNRIQLNNENRYLAEEMDIIINNLVKCTNENGEHIDLHLSADNSLEEAYVTRDMYKECLSVWQPKNNCIIIVTSIGNDRPGEFVEGLRSYFAFMERSSSNNDTINIFRYYETISIGGYTIYAACDNAMDLVNALQDYMLEKDIEAVKSFESKYEKTEYGYYLKEEPTEELDGQVVDTEEQVEIDLGTLPGNIQSIEVYEEAVESEEN